MRRDPLAVGDLPAREDHGASDGLAEMTLASSRWAEKKSVLGLRQEAAGRELEDERAVHLLVEVEIEVVERLVRVTEARLLDPALDEPVRSALNLVGEERGEEVERREPARLGFEQTDLEVLGHAGEPELAHGSTCRS